jgi:hypothetical protein
MKVLLQVTLRLLPHSTYEFLSPIQDVNQEFDMRCGFSD